MEIRVKKFIIINFLEFIEVAVCFIGLKINNFFSLSKLSLVGL